MPPLSSIITPDKPTVLIVDDEPAPRASLTHVLRQDFNILTADTAGAALVVLDQGGIDLVTLDLKLPDRPGSSLLRDIKLAHAAVEVIMVTAYGTLESAMDCIHQGAAGFKDQQRHFSWGEVCIYQGRSYGLGHHLETRAGVDAWQE